MSISTINSQNKLPVSRILGYAVGILGIFGVGYFTSLAIKSPDIFNKKAGLTANVLYGKANVYIDGQLLGATPFSSTQLKPGEHKVKLVQDSQQYETTVNFIQNENGVIHDVGLFRDLGASDIFSSGQDFWFEKDKSGSVLKIVSEPSGATVFIDNNEVGKTPFTSDNMSDGEYDLRVDYPQYESQTARINVKKGYALNVSLKLFPMPVPVRAKAFEDSNNLFDLSLDNTNLTADTQEWVNAIIYWNKTRGISLDGIGLNKEPLFGYFLDYKGNVFDGMGVVITTKEDLAKIKDAKRGAYLGRMADGTGLTKEAKDAITALGSVGLSGKTATIKETGTGWLRVRDVAGLAGKEVARVNVGQIYSVLEQATGWVKIKVSDTIQGWVSSDYVTLSQ